MGVYSCDTLKKINLSQKKKINHNSNNIEFLLFLEVQGELYHLSEFYLINIYLLLNGIFGRHSKYVCK